MSNGLGSSRFNGCSQCGGKVSSSVSNFIPQGKRGEYKEVTPKYQNDKVLSRVKINLNIVKVYEYSIPTRLGVCEGRKVRAALETLE